MRHRPVIVAVLGWIVVLVGCATGSPVSTPVERRPVPVPTSVQHLPGQPPVVHYGMVPDAALGVPFEYQLYVHCGIRTAQFAGRMWVALTPSDQPVGTPGTDQYLSGVMTLVAPERALFEWPGGRAEFEPARMPQRVCA